MRRVVAGGGLLGFGGDGGPALTATLAAPSGGARAPDGGVLIADTGNHRIRRVASDGTITTVAGSGPCCGDPGGRAGDGLAATDPAVRLNGPRSVAVHPDGRILIADTDNHQIRAIAPDGLLSRFAGSPNGTPGYSTEGGPASASQLRGPSGVAVAADGAILVADTGNHRILRFAPGTTATSRFAGATPTAGPGYSGDGGPASSAQLHRPTGLAVRPDGAVLIADADNQRIREVDVAGVIRTVAGNGTTGPLLGDDGPAVLAALAGPEGVVADADGTVLIADTGHARVRAVAPDGTIRTLAGTGTAGDQGDGGDPRSSPLSALRGVGVGPRGPLLYDTGNHRVRTIAPSPAPPPTPPAPPTPPPTRQAEPPGAAPQPALRTAAVATPVRGRVLVRVPGTRRFVPLATASRLPMGTEIDALGGAVALRFRTTRAGREATATVSEGRFVLRQSAARDGGEHPGVVVLSGPLRGCAAPVRRTRPTSPSGSRTDGTAPRGGVSGGAPSGARADAAAGQAASRARRRRTTRKSGRRVTVEARGKMKTRGKYGAATVRGTRWTMIDRCPSAPRPGTLTIVREGRVAVDAFVLRRRTLVRAGRSYLAPAKRR